MKNFLTRCPNPNCRTEFEVDESAFGKNVPCPSCSQVITAVPIEFRNRKADERNGVLAARAVPTIPVTVLLHDIRSLWNVGSIFRTSDAFAVEKLVLSGITGRPPRKEITKTALGAEEFVAWEHVDDPARYLARARERGVSIVALENAAGAVPLRDAALDFPLCLILGSEVAGVDREFLALADGTVSIEMAGIKSSLNVAVAYGAAMFAIAGKYKEKQ